MIIIFLYFQFGWFANPVTKGDYPELMKQYIAERSKIEGFPRSRLPVFTSEEVNYIKGTTDYLGLNHYTTLLASHSKPYPIGWPTLLGDCQITADFDPSWPGAASEWLKIVPWGFRKLLKFIYDEYKLPIYVTENGYSDYGERCDPKRALYYQLYLSALLDAIYEDEVDIKGYMAWSLMDNFEWTWGYQ